MRRVHIVLACVCAVGCAGPEARAPRVDRIRCRPDIYDNYEQARREGDLATRGGMSLPGSRWYADLREGERVFTGVSLPPRLVRLLSSEVTYTFTLRSDGCGEGEIPFMSFPRIVTVEQGGRTVYELKDPG